MLNDPQGFAEKLLALLRKSTDKFEVCVRGCVYIYKHAYTYMCMYAYAHLYIYTCIRNRPMSLRCVGMGVGV